MTAIHRPSVDLHHPRLIGAVGMAVFCFAALMSWRAGEGVVTVVFLVFVAPGLYLVLGSGHIAADGNVVTVSNPLGQYELAWQRVRRVESSAYGTLVLHADDARFAAASAAVVRPGQAGVARDDCRTASRTLACR